MKISEEQFNNEIKKMQSIKLEESSKLRIKAVLEAHVQNHLPVKIKSPYMHYFHYSYKMAFVSLSLVLCISLGTTYASQNSLPGDILYPIKTSITEPAIKLTKFSKEAKEDFDLSLADKRIQEIQLLVKEDKLTPAKLDENLALFEKHIEEKRKDREENKSARQAKKIEKEVQLLSITVDTNEDKDEQELDHKINMYRDAMLSKSESSDLYEHKAKLRLDSKRKHSKENQDKEEIKIQEESPKEETKIEDIKETEKEVKTNELLDSKEESKEQDKIEDSRN